jgi:uncharacterized protein
MKVHYREIVASDVDGVCAAYEAAFGVKFGSADPLLGGARTADGGQHWRARSIAGYRGARRSTILAHIKAALDAATKQGALVAHPAGNSRKGYIRDLRPRKCGSRVVATMIPGLTNRSSRPPSAAA